MTIKQRQFKSAYLGLVFASLLSACGQVHDPNSDRTASGATSTSTAITNTVVQSSSEQDTDTTINVLLTVGQTYVYTLPEKTGRGQTAVYQQLQLPSGAVFDTNKKQVSFTPKASDVGSPVLKFTQITPQGSFIYTINLTVKAANDPTNTNTANVNSVIFVPVPAQNITSGQFLSFYVQASSDTGAAVTVTSSNLPSGALFTNNRFKWTPLDSDAGTYQVMFSGLAGSKTASLSVTVIVTAQKPVKECKGTGLVYQASSDSCVCTAEFAEYKTSTNAQICILRSTIDTCSSQNRLLDVDNATCGNCKGSYFSQYVGYVGGLPTFACVEDQKPTCESQYRTYSAASNSCGLCKPGFKVDPIAFRAGNYTCILNIKF